MIHENFSSKFHMFEHTALNSVPPSSVYSSQIAFYTLRPVITIRSPISAVRSHPRWCSAGLNIKVVPAADHGHFILRTWYIFDPCYWSGTWHWYNTLIISFLFRVTLNPLHNSSNNEHISNNWDIVSEMIVSYTINKTTTLYLKNQQRI